MITRLIARNWRAYAEREFRFGPGVNFLVGGNGVGKTSALEAACYALTGEPQTVEDRTKMLRDPHQLATVSVELELARQTYVVERSQSAKRAESATLLHVETGEVLATGQRKTTDEVARLMTVSPDFLRRIMYMPEGDVFRFQSQPPGDAISQQVERVLGLRQMDALATAIAEATKRLKAEAREVGNVLDGARELKIAGGTGTAGEDEGFERRRNDLLADLRRTQDRIARQRRAAADAERLAPLLASARAALAELPTSADLARSLTVVALAADLATELTAKQERVDAVSRRLARLEGERAAAERVLAVLRELTVSADVGSCPVCGKPLAGAEREAAVGRVPADQSQVDAEERELASELSGLRAEAARHRAAEAAVGVVRDYLVHVPLELPTPAPTLADLESLATTRSPDGSDEETRLRQRAAELESELAELEGERAAGHAAARRLRGLGYRSFDEARDALVAIEARGIALRAAERAIAEVIARRRGVDLAPVFSQITAVSNAFLGRGSWTMQLDANGLPTLTDEGGRAFDFSQFSGGEKTALLVLIHTIIARQFATSSFLLIDEPLEHLDPVNRRSLIQFLVSACHRGLFRQAIVTTFEESLLRRYLSDEAVRITYL